MRIDIDREGIMLAPYVWRRMGAAAEARIEANMPGAYIRAACTGAKEISLVVCGSGNAGCPTAAMPVIEYSVDRGPFRMLQLTGTDDEYRVPLMEGADVRTPHQVDVFFRSARLAKERWTSSRYSLRIAGFELNDGASMAPVARRPKNAIAYGDSITEGVYSDLAVLEPGTAFYGNLAHNNARTTWFPIVCEALGCEYGQVGTGGQGMVVSHLQMPPLPDTWDHHDAGHPRLVGGRFVPEPDYVFCEMCTNDFLNESGTYRHLDVTEACTRWLGSLRGACPHALVFCIVPPLGWHDKELARVVSICRERGDERVYLIETAALRHLFRVDAPTQIACDGVHPHGHGNALLGALVVAEAQKAISA